jgi:glycosyltransferase involved in cell wall biosynthesis
VTITFNDLNGFERTSNSLGVISEPWEWIVIDGSDNPFVKRRVAEITTQKNGVLLQESDNGRFDAMNKGLQIAKGEIILFMNGGDQFYGPHVPLQIVDSYLENKWVWAVGQAIAVDSGDKFQWNWPTPKSKSLKFKLGIRSYCHQATVVKTEKLRILNGFIPDSLYSDWAISLVLEEKDLPFISEELWTKFLTGGISGDQNIEYWYHESIRTRNYYGCKILYFESLDRILQLFAKIYLSSTRSQLIRPDLAKKYG